VELSLEILMNIEVLIVAFWLQIMLTMMHSMYMQQMLVTSAIHLHGCMSSSFSTPLRTLVHDLFCFQSQGTADAVRQYMWLFEEHNVMEFLILAGDHLYRMDYQKFIQAHRETDADITVAALPMDEQRATAFGLMKIDDEGRIIEFSEKPKGEKLKSMMVQT